ncbi:MAG: broad specificity phosphatase PhoE [Sphingobacteriales bacterium]|jgi:broad specificity phosphatase PhoE
MSKLLYIIRHGQTNLNKGGIVQGRGVDSDLNDLGIRQGKAFYEAYKNEQFDKIYISTLKRTEQTVRPFIENGHSVEKLVGLDELDWGIHEGLKPTEENKVEYERITDLWSKGDYEVRMVKGESPLEVKKRQLEALKYILEKQAEKKILICMHGRAMRVLLTILSGQELSKMDEFPHTNLSLYIVRVDEDNFKVETFNNIAHLDGIN